MPGFPSIRSATGPSSSPVAAAGPARAALAAGIRAAMPHLAAGLIAGVLSANLRLGLGVPGHKALLWMLPILLVRLRWRHPVGATVGAVGACASLAVGGHLAGGFWMISLVPLAGLVLDAAVGLAERLRLSAWRALPLLAVAATGANLVCAAKRLAAPALKYHLLFGLSDPWASVLSYASVGLICGLAAGLAHALWPRRRGPTNPER